ncbi:mobile mystery protein A [Thioalkalivibrio thiocyanodenitrificans]|uniref:mobile mystery protein A n=1 Tax=Thioalkalivibrio thiocyanodenitrificans TaxID=243063 RepID=UPI000366CB30|nr:mobile mystery protein A [Thioalkalivibrio thiocyanodenitrificans]
MTANLRTLRRRQLDAALARWREAALPTRPSSGWVRAIRDALGMSSAALARRLGITDSAVRKLEDAESNDAITLATLRRLAASLDCELQYALVPKQSLDTMRTQRAMQIAREQVQSVARSMALEDQAVDPDLTEAQIKEIAQTLLSKSGKGLW